MDTSQDNHQAELPTQLLESEQQDYVFVTEIQDDEAQEHTWRQRVSSVSSVAAKEFEEIRTSVSHAVSNLQTRVRRATEDENSMLNKSKRAVDQGIRRGAHAAGSLWGDFTDVVQKGSHSAHEKIKQLKPGEKIQAAKQFGGKVLSGAEQKLGQLGQRASNLVEVRHQPMEFNGQEVTFDLCLHVYGGEQHQEEIELLAHKCRQQQNEAVEKLTNEQKLMLQSVQVQLQALLDSTNLTNVDASSIPIIPSSEGSIGELYNDVSRLCIKAAETAKKYMSDGIELGTLSIQAVHDEGLKFMCELLSVGLLCLLKLAKSLTVTSNATKQIKWPSDTEQAVGLIKGVALRLLQDLSAVNEAYLNAIVTVGERVALGNSDSQGEQDQLIHDLASSYSRDVDLAVKTVKEVYAQFYDLLLLRAAKTQM